MVYSFKYFVFSENKSFNEDIQWPEVRKSALDVFKHSIAFIKRLILTELDKQGVLNTTLKTEPKKINENEIGWVLTVPAIWDFTAKQFMREAAKRVTIYIGWGRTGLDFFFRNLSSAHQSVFRSVTHMVHTF